MSKQKSTKSKVSVKKHNTTTPSNAEMEQVIHSYHDEPANILLEKAKALTVKHPHHSFGWEFVGLAYSMLQDLDNALYATKRAAQLAPMDAEIQTNLGNLFKKTGEQEQAESCYRKALRIKPSLVQAHNNLGLILDEKGSHSEAQKYFSKAISIQPNYISAYINLGICFQSQGKREEAIRILTESTTLFPNEAKCWHNLGYVQEQQGLLESAQNSYQKALSLDQSLVDSYIGLSSLQNSLGNFDFAEKYARQGLAFNQENASLYNNLGNALKGRNQFYQAEQAFETALSITPYSPTIFNNLGVLYQQIGDFLSANHYFDQAIDEENYYPEAYSNYLFTKNLTDQEDYQEQIIKYQNWLKQKIESNKKFEHTHALQDKDQMNIGFVSGDFREHSVSRFLVTFLAEFSKKTEVKLFAYSNSPIQDETTTLLKNHFSAWRNIVGISDFEVAQRIHQDQVDVLIDLSGHTSLNRLPVFAYKPAPIQASWLGYFATTGVQQIDYIFVDRVGVPENNQSQFTEKLCYLPETRLCFSIPEDAPAVSSLPSEQNAFFTFGCFQHLSKVNDKVLTVWADIFDQVENAQLRWQCMQFADSELVAETQQRLARFGIGADRVRLLPSVHRQAYFSAHAEVDLILDTFPYPGGTTTCEALWMGVPTLTLAGDSLLGRQGASLLHAAGLADFIAHSQAEYVAKAVQFSQQQEKLSSLRNQMRQQLAQSALFDATRFADDFLKTIQSICHSHQ